VSSTKDQISDILLTGRRSAVREIRVWLSRSISDLNPVYSWVW